MGTTLLASPSMVERPGLAARNILAGDYESAFESMFQPQNLTPKQRDAFLVEHGLDKGPWAPIFRLLTNPLLILTLAVSYKFPVASAKNMFIVKSSVEAMVKRLPFLGRLTSMQAMYRGTGVPEAFGGVIKDVRDFRSLFSESMGTALQRFQSLTGAAPTQKQQYMVSAWLDGLHKPLRGWKGKDGLITIGKGASRQVVPEVGVLMPGLEAKMGQPLLQLGHDFRGLLDDMWGTTFGSVQQRKQLMRTIERMEKRGISDELTLALKDRLATGKKIEDYMPHRIMQSEEDFRTLMETLTTSGGVRAYAKSAERRVSRWVGSEALKRKYAMNPSFEELRQLGPDLVDSGAMQRMEDIVKFRTLAAARTSGKFADRTLQKLDKLTLGQIQEHYPTQMSQVEGEAFSKLMSETRPTPYSLKLLPVMSDYVHTSGSMYGWTTKVGTDKLTGGERLTGLLDEIKALHKTTGSPAAGMRAEMLENTYIPMALGRGTFKSALRAQHWDQGMFGLAGWIQKPGVKKLFGKELTETLSGYLADSKGAFSFVNLNQKAAGYFYLSTLGMNPASALKNLLQLVLTTGPTLGYKTTLAGIGQALKKSHKYFAVRLGARKLGHAEAIRFAWPEFAEAGLSSAPILDEVLSNTLQNAHNIAALPTGKLAGLGPKISRAMMSVFTASETAVRLSTWEAGVLHARRARMPIADVHKFAAKLVEETQFLTGPQNTPYFLVSAPPLARQLVQFPLRMLEFATHTAFNLGTTAINPVTGKAQNLLGKNPGTFARMIAGSIIAMEIGHVAGVDLSQALVGSAVPTFQEGREGAFGGFPIIPPAFQIVGNVAMGITSGDFTETMRTTPLLIPGGVSAFRAMGLVPGTPYDLGKRASKLFGRTYADYQQPAPDGRIAVYSGAGSLKGFFTPWEIMRQGLGIRSGDMQSEQELMSILVKNRDQIRQTRKDFLDARLQNDASGARSIAERFEQQFGFALPVTEKDLEAMQVRRRVSRLEQMVRTVPPGELRDHYIQLISSTLGASGQALLGIDPMLLGEPKPVREAARSRGPSASRTNPKAPYSTGPFDQINPQTLGRQPLPSTSRFGF